MEITPTARHLFEKCALGIVGSMTETMSRNKIILAFQDDLSKFLVAMNFPQQETETVAKEFVLNMLLKFGATAQILTDQVSDFLSEIFKRKCKLLNIRKIQTTAFHPESKDILERSHRILAKYLRYYVREDQINWDEWIPYAALCMRCYPNIRGL
jgi:transposase InsO family protein